VVGRCRPHRNARRRDCRLRDRDSTVDVKRLAGALASFAMADAEQTVKDYAALKAKGGAEAEAPAKAAKPAAKRERKSA
jgi:hypothetical protein